ncbi:phosphogluconate dehydratase [Amphiplicatus metriothermophilus]|uniref:Phosphogluconate dehydratase n=1 Tax=Amphiplicatus metriothermophilus TaxID=1519374 RepID=A0A239PNZ5_9PROT|nr:phosphogluconate dehydratase [Amphiplicatus metriothermophilus]MBB5518816.1 phosphogluconate dehydratase [Amphiplicatus metriothermophilus]SNT72029.1 6-phosphogluconate dehydratase [Amphiplicatus metriothermophilus]
MPKLNKTVEAVTARIVERSRRTRAAYLAQMRQAAGREPRRRAVSCGNLAHAAAACGAEEKKALARGDGPNIGIVTAYNDMLSAHQPLKDYPDRIKAALRELGATAQVAGGVPAMCDGVTQGQAGMDLSLFSRDVIALATAVSLSHDVYDGALMLGVCDKIVPGLFIGAARFGWMPVMFLPAGPMPSGITNDEKARVRQLYAEGKIGRDELLAAESASYHSPGTCTFYGTANSNQMMMEIMGLHLPGSAFVNPGTPLREAFVAETARRVASITALADEYIPFCDIVDERAIVNAVIGLHATGGSTNHTIHLIAMARAVGVLIDWTDFSDLSKVTPLLARVYPNGRADVNQFQAAGGLAFVIRELIDAGLLHEDVKTAMGEGLSRYAEEAWLDDGRLAWRAPPAASADEEILRPAVDPFSKTGGLVLLEGNLGRAVIKVSAVKENRRTIEAPAIVFRSQKELMDRFKAGELNRDFVAVVPFQGPKANGMPELHKLTPPLGVLQDKGYRVALVTDGRMSGASGKVPAAIHLTPEALDGGAIAKIRDGDVIRLDAETGELSAMLDEEELAARAPAKADLSGEHWGAGRELFAGMRALVGGAEEGAMTFRLEERLGAKAGGAS